jgi:hypothetical protein
MRPVKDVFGGGVAEGSTHDSRQNSTPRVLSAEGSGFPGAHAVGAVDVVVTNPSGQRKSLTGAFTYAA